MKNYSKKEIEQDLKERGYKKIYTSNKLLLDVVKEKRALYMIKIPNNIHGNSSLYPYRGTECSVYRLSDFVCSENSLYDRNMREYFILTMF